MKDNNNNNNQKSFTSVGINWVVGILEKTSTNLYKCGHL